MRPFASFDSIAGYLGAAKKTGVCSVDIILDVDVDEDMATIEEDSGDCRFRVGGHWAWNSYCFDYIVDSNEPDFEPSSESEILSFIFKE